MPSHDGRFKIPNVFTIPSGAPFLDTLVDALLGGRLVPGFSRELGPLRLADATIYVPTRRSARALAATFGARMGGTAFLPRIRALGALDDVETGLFFDESGLDGGLMAGVPAAIGDIERRMILTRLILGWSRSVRHAILAVDEMGRRETQGTEAFLVGTTAADAWHLSGELAALLDELVIEDVAWHAMKPLGTETFDRYWGITLDFLTIAIEQWPAILRERGQVDPATRQAALIEAEVSRLKRHDGGGGPLIVAGSTGSNKATSRMMAAIARLPSGAVVLPGLDQYIDDPSWEMIDGTSFDPGSAAGHAQASLSRLLPILGVARSEVVALGTVPPALVARAHFVSEALRPADSTDAWRKLRTGSAGVDLAAALEGLTVIEAADEREEALALALVLRETLDGPETAVLVTPDRTLARRVREELTRWGIVIDDSGGETLAQTSAGALARLAVDCVRQDFAPVPVLALLAHPSVRLGRSRATATRLARWLEIAALRQPLPAGALLDPAGLIDAVRERVKEKHASRLLGGLSDRDIADIERLLADLVVALTPLRLQADLRPLPAWFEAHEAVLQALTRTDDEASALHGADANALTALFESLADVADGSIDLGCSDYAALFDRMAAETPVRGPERSHPRLKILGLLEARLLSSDRILLGGLDETLWPPQVRTDAFLNRPMRAALGLTPPERRIGQSAHDLAMAFGQPQVFVSRAAKRGGSPTVLSRFLQRMEAVAGAAWAPCQDRGRRYLRWARALDRPAAAIVLPRPAPKPPVALRPTAMSVTRIEMLRRDPYAIYADRILRLARLDPIGAPFGPREWGTRFHGVLSGFAATFPKGALPANAAAILLDAVWTSFADQRDDPAFRAFMAPRLDRWARAFIGWEQERRTTTAAIDVEHTGTLELTLGDGSLFKLTAVADRIETGTSGMLDLIDFKTGRVPSKKEVLVGFAPQLTLEAAIAQRGGFPDIGADRTVADAFYVGFGAMTPLTITPLVWKDRAFADVVDDHLNGLVALLTDFRDPGKGYVARPYPQFQAQHNDYDHLSRVKEWSATGDSSDGGES